MTYITLLSSIVRDLSSAFSSDAPYRLGNLDSACFLQELPFLLNGSDLVVVRTSGFAIDWVAAVRSSRARSIPVILAGDPMFPDRSMMSQPSAEGLITSTVNGFLARGGPRDLALMHAYLARVISGSDMGGEAIRRG